MRNASVLGACNVSIVLCMIVLDSVSQELSVITLDCNLYFHHFSSDLKF